MMREKAIVLSYNTSGVEKERKLALKKLTSHQLNKSSKLGKEGKKNGALPNKAGGVWRHFF